MAAPTAPRAVPFSIGEPRPGDHWELCQDGAAYCRADGRSLVTMSLGVFAQMFPELAAAHLREADPR